MGATFHSWPRVKPTESAEIDQARSTWNVAELVEMRAAARPFAPALILPGQTFSFRQLTDEVHAVAARLLAGGIKPGQVVGVSMIQTPLHLLSLLALARIGAVSVPVHAMLPPERRRLAARRYGVAAIISGNPACELAGIPFILLRDIDATAPQTPLPPSNVGPDDPFRIVLSSGTSGDPKGMMYTHGYMLDRIRKSNYACTADSRILPMDFNFPIGFLFAMGMLTVGGAVVLAPEHSPAALANTARSCGVTHWLLSPSTAEKIALLLTDDAIHFPTVTHLRIVGSTPRQQLLDTLFARFTPHVYLPYGSTEIGAISMATPDILRRAPGSAGRVSSWLQAEVVDENDQALAPGQSGRLRLKAEGMITSYYRDPEHSATRFRNGWYYPRDLAHFDAEGLLYIEGREDDVVNLGGTKVYLHDIENEIHLHPSVLEASAFLAGQPGSQFEHIAVAFVSDAALTAEALREWAAERLGPQCPHRFVRVADMPRNTTGKIMRERLQALVADETPWTNRSA